MSRPNRGPGGPASGAVVVVLLSAVTAGLGASSAPRADGAGGGGGREAGERSLPDTLEFRHRDHRGVACVTCHPSEDTHGGMAFRRPVGCHQCHHASDDAPACTRCHAERDLRDVDYGLRSAPELSTGGAPERPLDFDHAEHESSACRDCHTEGVELAAEVAACAECHEDHHDPDARCAACHVDPPDEAHPVDVAHVTCGGSGCHTSLPFDRVPRTRQACLVCHQGLADHRPGRPCVECHPMSRSEPSAGEATPRGGGG